MPKASAAFFPGCPLPDIIRDDVRISYSVSGHGARDVLLLPSWMLTDSSPWLEVELQLAAHHRVIRYDSRGSGASSRPLDARAYSLSELVADARALLDTLDARRVVCVGHSFGSTLALRLSAYAERVLGVVLLAPTLPIDAEPQDPFMRALADFDATDVGPTQWGLCNRHAWRAHFDAFVAFFVAQAMWPVTDPAAAARAVAIGIDAGREVLEASLGERLDVRKAAVRARALLASVHCPSLVLHGSHDRIASCVHGERVAALLGAPFVRIEGAGHMSQVSEPGLVAESIASFTRSAAARVPLRPEDPGDRR